MMPAFFARPFGLEMGLGGVMLLVFMLGLFRPPAPDRRTGWATLAGLLVLFAASFTLAPTTSPFMPGFSASAAYVLDPLAIFAKRLFLMAAIISVLASLGARTERLKTRGMEYYVALMASLLGMIALASARELILIFVAFEVMSIPLYFLAGFNKSDDTAGEGALKFFLIGTVSSAVMLYGLSFVFGATGSTDVAAIPVALAAGNPLVKLGLTLTLAGLGFKIATVPFHMWVPDTYEAAPTPFVTWLSVAPKAAGFVLIFRLYLEGIGHAGFVWMPLVTALASMSVIAGNLMAIPQRNVKRMLGYSGIAHIGYLLMGIAAATSAGAGMILFYLVAYVFGNMGAFLCVQAVGESASSDERDAYRGLAQRSPVLALSLLVFLLSLGGIPFVAGFWAKLFIFRAIVDQQMYALAFLGAVMTIVALYYYLVLGRTMYIDKPSDPTPVRTTPVLTAAILICAAGTVVMGLYPEPWVRAVLDAVRGLTN